MVSPGSRNAPLIFAGNAIDTIKMHSVVDERSAAFVALGIAQSTNKPVGLVCTSGSALLNYYPAIAEAYYSNTPLIVLSADRPSAWIDQWDGQCIRQEGAFKNHIRGFVATPEELFNPAQFYYSAADILGFCFGVDKGPIHINIPIEEPFYFEEWEPDPNILKGVDSFSIKENAIEISGLERCLEDVQKAEKVIVFGGKGAPIINGLGKGVVHLLDILAENSGASEMNHWDALLSSNSIRGELFEPNLLLTYGKYTISKALKTFIRGIPSIQHWHISESSEIGNPFQSTMHQLKMDPKKFFPKVEQLIETRNSEYNRHWTEALLKYETAFENLDWTSTFHEFSAVKHILNSIEGTIHLGNSMPIRYASFVANFSNKTYRCNRGTSGIDGCVSTAIGSSSQSAKKEYLIVGDISFFYDSNALWNSLTRNLSIILMNNGGGRIFELINGPDKMGDSIDYQTTPNSRTAKHIAQDHQIQYLPVRSYTELDGALDAVKTINGPSIIEIFTDPALNKSFYLEFKSLG